MKPEEKAAFATSLFPPNFSLSNSSTRKRTVWTRPAQGDTAGNVAERVIGWQYQLGSALKVLYLLLNTKKRTANPPVNLGLIPSRRCAVIVISSSSSPAGWSLLFTSALVDQQYFSIAFLSSIIVTVFLSFFFYTLSFSFFHSVPLHRGWSGHCAAALRIAATTQQLGFHRFGSYDRLR